MIFRRRFGRRREADSDGCCVFSDRSQALENCKHSSFGTLLFVLCTMWAKILKMIAELKTGRVPSEASMSSTSSFSESTKDRLASENEYAFEEDGHRIEQPDREARFSVDRINSHSLSEASKQHSRIVNHRSVVAEKVAEV